jgi:hypothetical protein
VNNRYVIIATMLTLVGVTGQQMRELQSAGVSEAAPRAAGAAPSVEAAPSLRPAAPPVSGIGTLEMWNLKPSATTPVNLPLLKDLFKPFYSLSKNGRFQSVGRSDRPTEQWEFQGVIVRDGGYRALFYNAGLKRLKNLGRGDLVDERLAIRGVGPDSVTLEVVGEKKPQRFELRLFNANKESYVAKRKTP